MSADWPIGTVFNIASYALLLMMVAHVCDMEPYEFIYCTKDTHVYLNQMDKIPEQLSREPFPLPTMQINRKVDNIYDFKLEDFTLVGYQAHERIDYPVSV